MRRRETPEQDQAVAGGGWGPWVLYPAACVLASLDGYEIDLTDCRNSASVLDWIAQVAGKSWAGPETVAGLVRALIDVLDPQANLCPWGRSRAMAFKRVRDLVGAARDVLAPVPVGVGGQPADSAVG